jgi:hypothetical protein
MEACWCLSISIWTNGAPVLMSRVLYQEPLLMLALVRWIRGRDVVEIEIEVAL